MKAYRTSQGNWQLNFTLDGVQRTLYLGRKFSAARSEKIAKVVSELLQCHFNNEPVPIELLRRIAALAKRIQDSLYRFGLLHNQFSLSLQELYERFQETKTALKPSSQFSYLNWYKNLVKYFGACRVVSTITPSDCKKFFDSCKSRFSDCTTARGLRRCKTIFNYAVKQGFIQSNPFAGITFRVDTNLERQFYVSRDVIHKVLEHCRDDRERLAVALGRFAGLRVPSEIRELRYCDFTDDVIKISKNTKTGSRDVPLFAEVRAIFQRLHFESEEERIFPAKYRVREILLRSIRAAGLKKWSKLLVNLRSSCITDLVRFGYSEKVLDSIFGNSAVVRKIHYIQFQKELEYRKVLEDNSVLNNSCDENIIQNLTAKLSKVELNESEILLLRKLLVG
jgi:integrase